MANRRALRFAAATALALALAYGLGFPLPFMAPLFVVFLAMIPGPPMGPKGLFSLLLIAVLSLTVGVLLLPLLTYYPFTAVLLVGLGVYFSMYLTLIVGKRVLGMLLTVGFTMISVAGTLSAVLATTIIYALALGIATAVVCLWLVYPLFPDPPTTTAPTVEAGVAKSTSSWLALRATLIIMPAYLLALTNPALYLMTIMKSVSLGQQASLLDARRAGRELLGSTFAAGLLAVLFWQLLSIAPNLWMFSLWMMAFSLYGGAKLYGVLSTRFAPSFWINTMVTMIILLGPAVEDGLAGTDARQAFLQRFATFVGVTLYAWVAVWALEAWREARQREPATRLEPARTA